MPSLKPDLTESFLVDLKAKRKAVYRAPQLTRYGDLRSLTQGGTRGNPEIFRCASFALKTNRC
jgi:hypothetical protein